MSWCASRAAWRPRQKTVASLYASGLECKKKVVMEDGEKTPMRRLRSPPAADDTHADMAAGWADPHGSGKRVALHHLILDRGGRGILLLVLPLVLIAGRRRRRRRSCRRCVGCGRRGVLCALVTLVDLRALRNLAYVRSLRRAYRRRRRGRLARRALTVVPVSAGVG